MSDAQVTPMTPEGLRELKLQRAFRGYDPAAVDRLLQELATSLETAQREQVELRAQVQSLQKEIAEHKDASGLMRDALLSAQRAAQELRERTERECEEMVENARKEAEQVGVDALMEHEHAVAEVERLRQQEQELRASYKVLLHAALDRLGETPGDGELRPTLLDALAPRRIGDEAQASSEQTAAAS
jgi:cell division initiation protein